MSKTQIKSNIAILKMDNEQAREFLLKSTSYFSQNLPLYFDLDYLLKVADTTLGQDEVTKKNHIFLSSAKYSNFSNINYTIQVNKTSNTYRPISLIHPYLYVDYVNYLTSKEVWKKTIKRFEFLQSKTEDRITCGSIPFLPIESKIDEEKKEIALKFWQSVEQETIKLSLKYNHLLKLDISNFYGSIYTHSICWAMHGETKSKEAKAEGKLKVLEGNIFDQKFQYMNYGETVGIPQGNVLSDFISELLLAYVDSKLVESLTAIDKNLDYKILRYRDDYRVFTNSIEHANLIKRELVIILQRYKLSLSEAKTVSVSDVITGAIKEDKLFWIEHDPVIKITTDKFYKLPKNFLKESLEKYRQRDIRSKVFNKFMKSNFHNRIYSATLQKHLFILKIFSDKFPNSGQLIAAFLEFEDRFIDFDYSDFKKTGTDIEVLIAILVDVIKKNPKITDLGVKLLSTILQKVKFVPDFEDFFEQLMKGLSFKYDYEIRFALITSISENLATNNYNSYLEIWMQRLIVKNLKEPTLFIEEYLNNCNNELVKLCNSVVLGTITEPLFNEDWLKDKYKIDLTKFINLSEIDRLPDMISNEEINMAEYNKII